MEKFEIERDNGAALAFDGELIAKVSSSDNNAPGCWLLQTSLSQLIQCNAFLTTVPHLYFSLKSSHLFPYSRQQSFKKGGHSYGTLLITVDRIARNYKSRPEMG